MTEFSETIINYFKGERAIAYYAVPCGSLFLIFAFSILKWHWSNDITRGLFFPLVVTGILAVVAGLVLYLKSENDIERLTEAYRSDPVETVSGEIKRIDKVNDNWTRLKVIWILVAGIGIGLAVGVRSEVIRGVGLGLILIGVGGLFIDTIAEKRARIYQEQLISLPK